jgi:pSer/pThr/pTyr-binding forkhead associated (FHA) protein
MSDDLTYTEATQKNKYVSSSFLSKRGVLLILSSNFLGKSFIVENIKTVIGRQSDCDIVIKDPLISKKHCVVIIDEDGKFLIEDSNSKNSTFVNGKAIKKRTQIFYSDKIVIGDTILRFYHEEKLEKK